MTSLRIVDAAPTDCAAIAKVHVASWQAAYRGLMSADFLAGLSVDKREASWREVLRERRSGLLLAHDGETLHGFVSYGPARDGDAPKERGEIWALYVDPQAWSAGVGRSLWRAARERLAASGADSASLWVLEGNERAIAFYRKCGFEAEAAPAKTFEMGGATLREIRMVTALRSQ